MNARQNENESRQPDDDKLIPSYKFWEEVKEAAASASAVTAALGRCHTAKLGLLGSLATSAWIVTEVARNSANLTGTGLAVILTVALLVGGVGFASLVQGSKYDGSTKKTDTRPPAEP